MKGNRCSLEYPLHGPSARPVVRNYRRGSKGSLAIALCLGLGCSNAGTNSADLGGGGGDLAGGGSSDLAGGGGGGDLAGVPGDSSLALLAGLPGGDGEADGTGELARFAALQGIAWDGVGNLYVAGTSTATGLRTVRKIVAATGVVTTLNLPAGNNISNLVGDGTGNLYGSTYSSIVKLAPATSMVTLIAGASSVGSADGIGPTARFNAAASLAWDGSNLNGDYGSAYIHWVIPTCRSRSHEHLICSATRHAPRTRSAA